MYKFKLPILVAAVTLTACNPNDAFTQKLETQIDSVSYSLGAFNAKQLQGQGLKDINADAVSMGIKHIFNNDSLLITQEESQKILEKYFKSLQEKQEEEQRIEDSIRTAPYKKWMEENPNWIETREVNEAPIMTASGLQYEVWKNGKGDVHPTAESTVTVHYTGKLPDGSVFDSSLDRGEPATFPINRVIPGWSEGVKLMVVGDKWKITIPSALAYGEAGMPQANIPPNADIIFIVELISVQ